MKQNSSYKEIAKSTGIFGGSQLVNVFLGVIRSKLTAVFLGTLGVGIFGVLQSIIDFNRSISGLGLDSGAVKGLATAKSSSSNEQIVEERVYSISAWYLFTALLGGIICLLFAKHFSLWAFDNLGYTRHIRYMSIAVFFIALTAGLTAILQGLRKITSLALASTISSIVTLIVMIPTYYFWGMKGIVPMFIFSAIITFFISLFFYRKLKIKPIRIPTKEMIKGGSKMLELGVFIVIGGIISTGSILAVRAYIIRIDGLDAVGLFHTAWAINTLFWGIVLRSSNTDFFPKLCSIVDDKKSSRRFVNEQTHFVLLLIAPIIIALITFSQYVIQILFTIEFASATNTLQWHFVGAFFKIASTPMASIMLAKNRGGVHLTCEIIFWGSYLLTGHLLYPFLGIEALGVAYMIAYLIYIPIVLIAGKYLNGTIWDNLSTRIILINSVLFIAIYLSSKFTPNYFYLAGVSLTIISVIFSWYHLKNIFSFQQLKNWLKKHISR